MPDLVMLLGIGRYAYKYGQDCHLNLCPTLDFVHYVQDKTSMNIKNLEHRK
jgi:hypothetical protein